MGQLLRKCAPRQSQQQNLKRQEQFMLLLVVLSPCYIGVSSAVPIFLRNGIDAQTACGIYACTGHGFPAAFLLTTFSLPSRISANGSFRNFVGVPLHNSHRRSGGRDVQPFSSLTTDDQRLVKTHCTPWGNLSSRAHLKGRRGTTTLPMWEDLRIEAVAHGSAMCLVMRAHTHRSRSRLGRPQSHRKALLRNLATQLLRHGSITTTAAKGQELCRVMDAKLILAKKGGLHNYRQALGFFYDKKLTRALFKQARERFARRNSGFCRRTRLPFPRLGDASKICKVELLD